jgi:ribosomal protein S18 acetylase RimI-like enzyme
MKPKIRALAPKDKPSIIKILNSLSEFKPFEVVVAEELIDSYLQDPTESGYYIMVAEVDSAVAGYICYGPTPLTEGTWDIYWVAVAREKQGQGVGGALIASAEDKIREAQGRLIFVETSGKPEYEKTKRFYRDQGYEIICQILDFYAPGDDKLILQKRLRRNI